MKNLSLAPVLVGLITLAACGGSAPAGGDASGPASAGTGSSGTVASGKVVAHEQLLQLLPSTPEWTREGEPQGSTDQDEKVSRVQVNYIPSGSDKASGLGVEIMDTAGNNNILAPLREFIRANREQKSGAGDVIITTSPVQVLGFPAMQEWTPSVKNGTLSILVADRFTVGITANSVAGPEVMRKAAEAIDLKKLAALK